MVDLLRLFAEYGLSNYRLSPHPHTVSRVPRALSTESGFHQAHFLLGFAVVRALRSCLPLAWIGQVPVLHGSLQYDLSGWRLTDGSLGLAPPMRVAWTMRRSWL